MENPGKITFSRFVILALFAIAFAYIEAAVVVYLRELFYPDGFTFPIKNFLVMPGAAKFVLYEIAREAATLVLMVTAAYLMAGNFRQRLAYLLIIFAVWDIFFYLWLKVMINWPSSLLDWDILFLIPLTWSGPVLAPVVTSLTMLLTAAILLGRKTIKLTRLRTAALSIAVLMIMVLYCIAGLKITQPDYKSYFSWPIFAALHLAVIIPLFQSAQSIRSN